MRQAIEKEKGGDGELEFDINKDEEAGAKLLRLTRYRDIEERRI